MGWLGFHGLTKDQPWPKSLCDMIRAAYKEAALRKFKHSYSSGKIISKGLKNNFQCAFQHGK